MGITLRNCLLFFWFTYLINTHTYVYVYEWINSPNILKFVKIIFCMYPLTKYSVLNIMFLTMVFQWSCLDVRVGLWRKLSTEELMLLNGGVGETLENPLDCKKIQPVYHKENQSWIFIGRTDVEAKTPILWPPDEKSWLIWKDPDAGKGWRREEKGMTEDEMAGWHHQLDERGFGWTLGVGDGLGGLVCCNSWDCKDSDMTEWLNWTEMT